MQTQANNFPIHAFSAFKRTNQPHNALAQTLAELEAFTQQLINSKKKVILIKAANYFNTSHPLCHILIDMVQSLRCELANQNNQGQQAMTSAHNQNVAQVSIALFKNICIMIQQSLFEKQCKYLCQLSLSMLFQRGLIQTFKLCFLTNQNTQNHQNIHLSYFTLDNILNSLLDQNYRKLFTPNIYTLHSGSNTSISKLNFSQNLKCIVTNIGKVFTQKTNLITRNLKNIKKSKFVNQIVTNSIKTICNYRNQEFIEEEIQRVSMVVFGDRQKLAKGQFQDRMNDIFEEISNKKQSPIASSMYTFFLYIDLFRVQTLMIQDSQLKTNIIKQKQVNSSNFFTQEMQKLLKKCPYNGDQCCNCKKCQCVRRNRQSAKLSQEKKRNAVQQLDPMRKRIEELERRNKQLEEENKILRGIVSELKNNQGFKSTFNSTIQSVSKVLDN